MGDVVFFFFLIFFSSYISVFKVKGKEYLNSFLLISKSRLAAPLRTSEATRVPVPSFLSALRFHSHTSVWIQGIPGFQSLL